MQPPPHGPPGPPPHGWPSPYPQGPSYGAPSPYGGPPFGGGPGAAWPPGHKAPVWPYYVAYTVAMAVMYLVVAVAGVALMVYANEIPPDPNELPPEVTGAILAFMGIPLMAMYGVAPFLPKKSWAWTYHIVLIAISLTSACCMLVGIPLIIYWLKPETKAMFGKYA